MLKLMPMNIYDVAAQQARMEDQAARGWFAVSVPGIFFLAVFEKGEPKAVRYRLEPAPVKESCPDPERLAAYQSMGWEYVDTSGKSMHLWRCDDPDAPELHTDPETEAQAYDRLFRRQQKVTQFWAAVTALLAVLAVQTLLTERTLLVWSVQEWKPLWREAAYWGFLLALALAAFRQWWSLRRYLRPLRAGVPVCHRRPYRLACGLSLAIMLLWGIYIASLCADMADPRSRPFEPAETFDEPVPYITEKGLQEVQAIHWDNWLTTDQWWTFEGMGDWETENRYYRLRFPWLADDLVDGILADYQEKGWPVMAWQIPGLDETWVSTRDDYGYWFLVVRLGDQVWSISTGTTEPTIDLAERYAAVLAEVQQKERGERSMSGRQEYREFRPVELYDVAAVESWLEERDREGYHLLRFRGLYGIFYQDCSVALSRYRLQPLLRKEKSPPPEMTDAYRELGWEYVCTLAGTFHIWRCGDPAAPELDTDPVVQSMGYGYLERKMRRHLLRLPAILLVCLGICVLPWFWGAGDMPLVDQLEHALPGEGLFWLLMAAAAVGFELLDAFRMRRLLRSLGTGVPLERPRSWRLQKRVTQAVMVLIWAGVLISWLLPDGGDPHFTRSAMDGDGEPLAEVVYVDLRELEGSEELTGFSAERKSLLLAPRMYWTRQSTEGPGGPLNLISGNTSYYRMGTEGLALRVEEELKTWQEWFGGGEPERLKVPGLDSFWWAGDEQLSRREDLCQCVVARRGNCVLMFSYTGHKDLRIQTDYFAAVLMKFQ